MKKIRISNIVSVIILIIMILFTWHNFPEDKEYIYVNSLSNNIGEIYSGNIIKQTFYANEDNLSGIGIVFGKYMKDYNSDIEIIISDDDDVITRKVINGKDIKEGKFTEIDFFPIDNSKGKMYEISIIAMGNQVDERITIYTSQFDDYSYGELYINDVKQDNDISFMAKYKENKKEELIEILKNSNLNITTILVVSILLLVSLFELIKILLNLLLED